jgi:Fe-S-cluster containining protein
MIVPVTSFDAQRIARRQRLPFAAFLEPFLDAEPDAQSLRLDASDERYQVKLRQSRVETAACGFLALLGGEQRRCGIYADRPIVCAVYPFVSAKGSVELRSDARCAPGDWNLSLLDFRGFRTLLGRYAAERDADATIVNVWNAAVASGAIAGGFDVYCGYASRAVERFQGGRDEPADTTFLECWHDPGLAPDIVSAQVAWLAAFEACARDELAASPQT